MKTLQLKFCVALLLAAVTVWGATTQPVNHKQHLNKQEIAQVAELLKHSNGKAVEFNGKKITADIYSDSPCGNWGCETCPGSNPCWACDWWDVVCALTCHDWECCFCKSGELIVPEAPKDVKQPEVYPHGQPTAHGASAPPDPWDGLIAKPSSDDGGPPPLCIIGGTNDFCYTAG